MNEILIRIVVDASAFFELGDEDVIDPDVAVKQLESIRWELQRLDPDEKKPLLRSSSPRRKRRTIRSCERSCWTFHTSAPFDRRARGMPAISRCGKGPHATTPRRRGRSSISPGGFSKSEGPERGPRSFDPLHDCG
jgi:hypothetical protein